MSKDIEKRIDEQFINMLAFKNAHNLKVHPLKTLRGWAEHIIKERNGYCPCDNSRPACPCPQAPSEIKENGKCFCGKFFTPEKFEEIWGSYMRQKERESGGHQHS